MLDLDARIDSTLFSSGKGARELYERYSTFMDRFYVGRWKRWIFVEPLSEAATSGSSIVMGSTACLVKSNSGAAIEATMSGPNVAVMIFVGL